MRIITYNVNGIRAAIRKGFADWLKTDPADVICLQEVKAKQSDVDLSEIEALGYKAYWYPAQKPGYSGVAILSKLEPSEVSYGDGRLQSDAEGRVIRADFGDLTVINAYFPSGTTGEIRQTYKYQWLDEFMQSLDQLKAFRPNIIVCGDYNIAHTEIDIHNPKSNQKTSGFLPEERAWMDRFLASGFVDAFRHHQPGTRDAYSWWSTRANSRANNKGWRIDYISLSEPLRSRIHHARILPDVVHSDHCPVYVEMTSA